MVAWGPFFESPETYRAHFGWHHSLCIFKTKASRGTKLCRYYNIYSLYNIWKDKLWPVGQNFTNGFSGLPRNGASGILQLLRKCRFCIPQESSINRYLNVPLLFFKVLRIWFLNSLNTEVCWITFSKTRWNTTTATYKQNERHLICKNWK